MKSILVLTTVFISTSAFANTITCKFARNGHKSSLEVLGITFQADVASATELQNIVMTVENGDDDAKVEKGGAPSIKAKNPYNPIKKELKKTNLFELDLVNLNGKEKGKEFGPYDQCAFTINLPKDIDTLPRGSSVSNIHLLAHCDQNGGLDLMTCTSN